MIALSSLPPLSLYIHIPWCVKKCPYCDFNSHTQKAELPEQAYIDALLEDLTRQLPQVWGRRLHSIFIGGGTPSLFSAESLDRLLSGIRSLIPFNFDIEITLEANPGTAEADKFKGFFDAGINRLSIGVQSFNDSHLKTLGRIHSASEVDRAIDFANKAGFQRINLDLMHGLPGQSISNAQQDLLRAIDSQVSHISWYQLTLEPNTLFYQQPPSLPADDTLTDIQDAGESLLANNGFHKYEVSAYAKQSSLQSQHNLNYWSFGDYLAIGAGGHGKITLPAEQQILRYSQFRSPKDYLNADKPYTQTSHAIDINELPLEFMMNAMRLTGGVPETFFNERTDLAISVIENQLSKAETNGLLVRESGWLKPTLQGQRFLNDLLEIFMPEHFKMPKQIPVTKVE